MKYIGLTLLSIVWLLATFLLVITIVGITVFFIEDKNNEIGIKALPLLHDGQVIIISGGTTNLFFSKLIPLLLKATIYTYSLPIAMQLSQYPNIDLIFLGG